MPGRLVSQKFCSIRIRQVFNSRGFNFLDLKCIQEEQKDKEANKENIPKVPKNL